MNNLKREVCGILESRTNTEFRPGGQPPGRSRLSESVAASDSLVAGGLGTGLTGMRRGLASAPGPDSGMPGVAQALKSQRAGPFK